MSWHCSTPLTQQPLKRGTHVVWIPGTKPQNNSQQASQGKRSILYLNISEQTRLLCSFLFLPASLELKAQFILPSPTTHLGKNMRYTHTSKMCSIKFKMSTTGSALALTFYLYYKTKSILHTGQESLLTSKTSKKFVSYLCV